MGRATSRSLRAAEEALREYVAEMAGTEHDLIEELEVASVEHLAQLDDTPRTPRNRR
jgi:hypothetical protein